MKFNSRSGIVVKAGLCLLIVFALAACQGNLLTYRGKIVDADRRIELTQGGPHQETWQTNDLSLNYAYVRDQKSLKISGDVKLRYDSIIAHFYLTLHFLDSEGRIIDDERILTADFRQTINSWHFKKEFILPQHAASIAFSYSGQARGFGPDSSAWDFWKTP